MFTTTDTIVAVATPPGSGGLGVVRLSGGNALALSRALCLKLGELEPRRATFARIGDHDHSGRETVLDEVVVTFFKAPHSYTREDVVEISAHGSPVVLERIVSLALRAGARLAEPGEFTLRAYLNGRIDLVQAEAVADLIAAVTPAQARAAMDQLEGTLTGRLASLDARLFDLAARLEASIDFPEEGFHFVTRGETARELAGVSDELAGLCKGGASGRLLREGAMVVIIGRPNAGKSSLFNALVGVDRAIVTDIPGTTRDVLAERVDIHGVPVTLVDTAGVREARDIVEAEGIRRAKDAASVATLALVVVDRSEPAGGDEELGRDAQRRVVVRTKADLPEAWELSAPDGRGAVDVSAVTGAGLEELRSRIVRELANGESLRDTPAISNIRHLALAERARDASRRAADLAGAGDSEEVVLFELTVARQALEEITGARTDEDVLKHIFIRFCVGK